MKKLIAGILRRGYTTSAKSYEEIVRYLYPLQFILEEGTVFHAKANGNPFWHPENSKNLMDLYHDVLRMYGHNLRYGTYYHIINRFENGDAYGIVKEGYGWLKSA